MHCQKKNDIERVMKQSIKEEVNVRNYLVENYLPELSFSDVEMNRHRECHRGMNNS